MLSHELDEGGEKGRRRRKKKRKGKKRERRGGGIRGGREEEDYGGGGSGEGRNQQIGVLAFFSSWSNSKIRREMQENTLLLT